MKWSSKLWGILHMNIALIKADPMHVLFVDGVVNKVMGVLLFQISVARHDLPGKTIEERVAKAWCDIQSHYHPYAPPITELKAKTFRHGVGEGLSNVSLRAKAKETWDLWAGVHALVRSKSASAQEKHIAHHLDQIIQLMKQYALDATSSTRWLNAEINVLTLYVAAGFPTTPKFHMMQHIYMNNSVEIALPDIRIASQRRAIISKWQSWQTKPSARAALLNASCSCTRCGAPRVL